MSHDLRWVQRFQNFDDAYQTFGRVFERYQATPDDEVIQIALIQAFDFIRDGFKPLVQALHSELNAKQ